MRNYLPMLGRKDDPPIGRVVHTLTSDEVETSNRERSQREVIRFKQRVQGVWFAYFQPASPRATVEAARKNKSAPDHIATWMGDTLATVTWTGAKYKCPAYGHASERINFRAIGIDGRNYSGTYFYSSGNYVRMRVVK